MRACVREGACRDQNFNFLSFVNNQQSAIILDISTEVASTTVTHKSHYSAIMSDQNGVTMSGTENVNPSETVTAPKGKGKAVDPSPHEVSMGEDDESSDEETGAEEDV